MTAATRRRTATPAAAAEQARRVEPIHNSQFVLWSNFEDGAIRWIISDTTNADRICDSKDERFVRRFYRIVTTQNGWWNDEGRDNGR